MSLDRNALIQACTEHGVVARVVVASVRGSAPREVGAAMLVWQDGFTGTIGGGTLEHAAISAARSTLEPGHFEVTKHALGPDLGQCCGGAVELVFEVFDSNMAQALAEDVVFRGRGDMSLAVARIKAGVRNQGDRPDPQLIDGWMIEPVSQPTKEFWIWGAGHVGRALVQVLAPLPDTTITWVDIAPDRFPKHTEANVTIIAAQDPERLVRYAPSHAEHLIVTLSHQLDLALCDALLRADFNYAGLIGSKTKWARFRSRLSQAGHDPNAINRITCPIGDPRAGKHPHVIALTVASDLMARHAGTQEHQKGQHDTTSIS